MRYEEDEYRTKVYREPTRSSMEWCAIIFISVFLAILASDGMRVLIVGAWAKHQLEQLEKDMNARTEAANRKLAEQTRERERQQKARAEREAYQAKFNSDACRFWRETHERNPGQKTARGIEEHCP